ncbi:hypothetical protein ACIPM2_32260 [Streptomyces sp. NPDC086081]|uniref:hypothetical protein n=1 Tax=Streptomyces sp. NPDC086081 TaxID=3365749 RepID=UPI0038251E5B
MKIQRAAVPRRSEVSLNGASRHECPLPPVADAQACGSLNIEAFDTDAAVTATELLRFGYF